MTARWLGIWFGHCLVGCIQKDQDDGRGDFINAGFTWGHRARCREQVHDGMSVSHMVSFVPLWMRTLRGWVETFGHNMWTCQFCPNWDVMRGIQWIVIHDVYGNMEISSSLCGLLKPGLSRIKNQEIIPFARVQANLILESNMVTHLGSSFVCSVHISALFM